MGYYSNNRSWEQQFDTRVTRCCENVSPMPGRRARFPVYTLLPPYQRSARIAMSTLGRSPLSWPRPSIWGSVPSLSHSKLTGSVEASRQLSQCPAQAPNLPPKHVGSVDSPVDLTVINTDLPPSLRSTSRVDLICLHIPRDLTMDSLIERGRPTSQPFCGRDVHTLHLEIAV